MDTKPIWQEASPPRFSPLQKAGAFDVVVIGGGITGLSAALFLKQAGKTVCLLERDRIGSGDTGHTTAHLTYVTDLRLKKLINAFGEQEAALTWYAGATAIDLIEQIVREHAMDCQFQRVPGFLHASLDGQDDETDELQAEAELAKKLGFAAEFVSRAPIVDKPGIRFRDQAKFHPLKYLAAIAQLVEGNGCEVHEESEVTSVESDPLLVEANEVNIACEHLVIATHVPLVGKTNIVKAALLQTKLAGYSSYAVGGSMTHGSLPEVSLWDTSDPYYYLRVDRHGEREYAIFGGADHKTGQETESNVCYAHLEEKLEQICPQVRVDHHWSGQVIETNDGLPLIGESAARQFVATGFGGNGMTFGTLAGMMARDFVLEKENPWQDLFSLGRTKLRGGTWDYLKENVDFPYYFVADRVARPKTNTTRQIKRGQGQVLKLDGQRVACSRDESGTLHQVSAVCTHMGCLLRWNDAEHTWDCPCHGSRFRPSGEVLAGPAETPLEPFKKSNSKTKETKTKSAAE